MSGSANVEALGPEVLTEAEHALSLLAVSEQRMSRYAQVSSSRGRLLINARCSARPEQTIAGVTESGKYVTLSVQLSIERRRVHLYVRMRFAQATNSLRCGDEA